MTFIDPNVDSTGEPAKWPFDKKDALLSPSLAYYYKY
jgi:hypothetical protein